MSWRTWNNSSYLLSIIICKSLGKDFWKWCRISVISPLTLKGCTVDSCHKLFSLVDWNLFIARRWLWTKYIARKKPIMIPYCLFFVLAVKNEISFEDSNLPEGVVLANPPKANIMEVWQSVFSDKLNQTSQMVDIIHTKNYQPMHSQMYWTSVNL